MNHDELKEIARHHLEEGHIESDSLEYKKSDLQKDKILKTLCAFANNLMNRPLCLLLLGVEESKLKESKGTPIRPISGFPSSAVETIENNINALIPYITPKIHFEITDDTIDGKSYIIVAFEPQFKGPYEVSEKAEKDKSIHLHHGRYVRIERDSRIATVGEEILLLKKFADYHFTENANSLATLNDLNIDQMKEFLRNSSSRGNTLSLNKEKIAEHLGLLSENRHVKNYAVLMFSDHPERFIPGAFVEVIEKFTDSETVMQSREFTGPVWKQDKNVMQYLRDFKLETLTLRSPEAMESKKISNYPYDTCEELITNAIVHKDYENPRPVQIYLYLNRIVINNYNQPLPPVTLQALNHETEFPNREYENPSLRTMFKDLDLIESYGSGVGKAKRSMRDNGSPAIHYEEYEPSIGITSVMIPIQPEFQTFKEGDRKTGSDTENKNSLEIISVIKQSKFNRNTKENMIFLCQKITTAVFSRTDIARTLGISNPGGTKYIQKMLTLKIIDPVKGKGKGKYTFVRSK